MPAEVQRRILELVGEAVPLDKQAQRAVSTLEEVEQILDSDLISDAAYLNRIRDEVKTYRERAAARRRGPWLN